MQSRPILWNFRLRLCELQLDDAVARSRVDIAACHIARKRHQDGVFNCPICLSDGVLNSHYCRSGWGLKTNA